MAVWGEDPKDWSWKHWYRERSGKGRGLIHRLDDDVPWALDKVEHISGKEFSRIGDCDVRIQIGNFTDFGRGLVMSGMCQLAEAVDKDYTFALVFPAALTARSRKRWFIAGAGDGAAIREALRFRDTEHVRMAEISRMVVRATQEWIPSFWAGCQHDKRLDLRWQDARDAAEEIANGPGREKADIVLLDLVDESDEEYTPEEKMTADHVYGEDGLAAFKRAGAENHILVVQSHECSEHKWNGPQELAAKLRKLYRRVAVYRRYISFFGYEQSFAIATDDEEWFPDRYLIARYLIAGVRPANSDAAAALRYHYAGGDLLEYALQHYDEEVHRGAFALPIVFKRRLS